MIAGSWLSTKINRRNGDRPSTNSSARIVANRTDTGVGQPGTCHDLSRRNSSRELSALLGTLPVAYADEVDQARPEINSRIAHCSLVRSLG